ncbi:MAG: type ISP restriction/modification enzyme [Dehalococcoidia bacterium]|nr:type ISP restriction/modification enzyme [Dehalococcoidia bacterium]
MTVDAKPVQDYIHALEKELAGGNTTEHSHRPALKALLEALVQDIIATNEPQHIINCGAPDFRVHKNKLTIGYAETKDVGKNLDEALKTDQLKRYLASLHNLVLTNYLEFRWFVHGKHRLTVWLGTVSKDGKIKREKDGIEKVAELLDGFLRHEPEPVGTARELVSHMARLAGMIRHMTVNTLKAEQATGSLHAQLLAFRENLIPELSIEQFADMYAQTIAYGLFAARCESDSGKDFTREKAEYLIPKTNPFLRQLFHHIAFDLDEQIVWVVDDLAQVLALAHMDEVLKGFGKPTAKEDPVVHFYETFLKAYDPAMREMRGVYYTPTPVVSYIVRSIDHLLKTRFGKPQGLADPDVLILDPAVGTATFLYMVIQEIYSAIISQGQQGIWNDYVTEKLLPRLFGFELLMAPYTIAHFKLERLLKELGYQFRTDKRLGIYLTNTLEEAVKHSEALFAKWITDENNAAAEIKKEKPIMVVLGNPPYSGHSANKGKRARELVQPYYAVDGKPLGEKNPKWLQDDYVKFLAFGQWRIDKTGEGILGFITNHSYLDNPTFRGMRQSLMNSFTDIYILNLHGNAKKKETSPDGGKDENVFDIQQGVAIGIFVKEKGKDEPAKVHYADIWGIREGKQSILSEINNAVTEWQEIEPVSPFYMFVPLNNDLLSEYEKGWKVTEIFPVNSVGIVTSRDDFVLDFDDKVLRNRIEEFLGTSVSDDGIREKYELTDNKLWNVTDARTEVRKDNDYQKAFAKCLYRPFDIRPIFYHDSVIERSRHEVMRHMLAGDNLGLITVRQVAEGIFNHIFVSRTIVESRISLSNKGIGFCFPLYLYPKDGELQLEKGRKPNLNPAFIKEFSEKLGLNFIEDGKGDLSTTFGPEDIFNYAYAVFHSPAYRSRYAEFLKMDFPRLPLTSDKELFKKLAEKGAELVALHLLESPVVTNFVTTYPVSGDHSVEKVSYDEKKRRVNINKTQYFEGVPPEVWNFHIGGYQVAEKWLKDRQKAHRKLSHDDVQHYQKIIVALKETIRLMAEIDELIPGWPVE